MNRNTDGGDTDSRVDWHISPTSGFSFGGANTNDVYTP